MQALRANIVHLREGHEIQVGSFGEPEVQGRIANQNGNGPGCKRAGDLLNGVTDVGGKNQIASSEPPWRFRAYVSLPVSASISDPGIFWAMD